jgi:hypothetical protein
MYRNYGGDWAANGVAREMKIGVPPLRFAGMRCSRPPGSFRVHFMRNALATSLRAWPLSRRMGVFGEFEREIVREQVVTRLARAKVHGRKSGKPIGRPAVS